jgi:hypothetical protein
MSKIKVYVTSGNVLTIATNEIKDEMVADDTSATGYRLEHTEQPTTFVGYLEAADPSPTTPEREV